MIEENKDLLKFNAEGIHPADMFLNAKKKAVEAVDTFTKEHGEPMYCGFASISIHPARGRFVSFMKKAGVGDTGYGGGYRISYYDIMPQDHQYSHTQSMSIKEIATEAFRDELRKYGMTVYAESRAD
jgi:hypothetical protein